MADDKKIAVKIENLFGKKETLKKEAIDKTENGENDAKEKVKEIISEKALAEISPSSPSESKGVVLPARSLSGAKSQSKQRQKQVEKVLESGLEKIYSELSDDKKKEFKIVGEQTAVKINQLLDKTKIKIKSIINLIKKWLSLIPRINKYFIEQEAKIKTDEIIKIKEGKK
ncbi:MAG: hypothetical protein AAB653_03190 [Patescibacteria group bacterium]